MSFPKSFFHINLWIFLLSAITLSNGYIDVLFNPDGYSPHELIKQNGYPLELYHVQTPDGYILELQRIPHGVTGKSNHFPILCIHGFSDASFSWVANGPERALAYLLADQGYDIWMINLRGTELSRNHVNYTSKDPEFWDFSIHELGIYDVPTVIDFILNKTNHEQLLCICNSVGNIMFYIMLSELPQYNDKIVAQVSLALYYHPRMTPRPDTYDLNTPNFPYKLGPFMDRNFLTKVAIQIASNTVLWPDGYTLYDLLLSLIYGLHRDHINREVAPIVYHNFPSGSSQKAALHIAQLQKSFSLYDYGPAKNQKLYGTPFPPDYNTSNIQLPVRMYHAEKDHSSNPKEVHMLYDNLLKKAGVVQIADPYYSHADFLYNRNNNELLNNDVLDFVNYIVQNATTNTQKL